MNEQSVIGGAVSQLQVWEIHSYFGLPCLHGNLDSCRGRNAGGENQQTDMIYMQWPSNRDTEIVGHIPYYLAPRMSAFFMRENKVTAEITGAKVNRGAGYGLEVLCVYRHL